MPAGLLDLSPIRSAATARLARWAEKRQGADGWNTRLRSGRIYILPTGVGLIFGLMTFVMLLGSMNYNNNLSFGLTFLLAALGFVSMHQCQRTLVDLEIAFAGVDPVFAGQSVEFRIALTNHAKSWRHNLRLFSRDTVSEIGDLAPGESRIFRLERPTGQRGTITLERFGVRTLYPFELFRAWAWLHMDIQGLVYPHPADNVPYPPDTQSAHGHRQHDARGEEDFAGLRQFHHGDSPRHIAWKAYARSGELLSKQFAGSDTSSQWFEFDQLAKISVEERLSILTRWIVDADRTHRDYGLRVPGVEIPPAHGDAHRHHCLRTLALFEVPDRRS